MTRRKLSACLLSIVYLTSIKAEEACTTPSGKIGSCVVVDRCRPLLVLLRNIHRSPAETELLINSQCGRDELRGKPKVCCEPACKTPDGHEGECVDIGECDNLKIVFDLPRPLHPDVIDYVRAAHCGPSEDAFRVCCSAAETPSALRTTSPPAGAAAAGAALLPDAAECGLRAGGEDRIVGGDVASIDDHPWLALVERPIGGAGSGVEAYCGATLVSRRYLVTAAHCHSASRPPTGVRLGEYNVKTPGPDCEEEAGGEVCTDGAVSVPIEAFVVHPEYNLDKTGKNDIAVVRMAHDVAETRFISPICLPNAPVDVRRALLKGRRFVVAGWGLTELDAASDRKRHVAVPLVDTERCDADYRSKSSFTIWDRQLCAGAPGKDSCNGDSGGPLAGRSQEGAGRQFELVGVVSFGARMCGSGLVPGVYTSVYPYLDWIKAQMRP